ncbi:MAG TPA: beta/gamma crystallin-related protein, partial [Thermoanaerobaculia bacterium]
MGRTKAAFLAMVLGAAAAPSLGQLTLYEDVNFGGRSIRLTGNTPDLRTVRFNDFASSGRLDGRCSAVLYADVDYRGASWAMPAGSEWSDFRSAGGLNDGASSVQVECRPGGSGRGVTLFVDENYGGAYETFTSNVPRLSTTRIGNDRVSSLRVSPGCRARVYTDDHYRGASMEVSGDMQTFRYMPVNNDDASSIQVDCGGSGGGGGGGGGGRGPAGTVTLYRDRFYGGASQVFRIDTRSLAGSQIGNDGASSLRVSPGCRVRLFADNDFGGRFQDFSQDVQDLGATTVGNDAVSSLRIQCGGGGWGGGSSDRGITVYHDPGFRGGWQKFTSDVSDMGSNDIGHDAAGSLRLDPGCTAILYVDRSYRGRSARAVGDIVDLAASPIGRDSLSSFRLECGGGVGGGGWEGGGARRAVRIFGESGHRAFVGEYSVDVPDLNSPVGSVDLDPGC